MSLEDDMPVMKITPHISRIVFGNKAWIVKE